MSKPTAYRISIHTASGFTIAEIAEMYGCTVADIEATWAYWLANR